MSLLLAVAMFAPQPSIRIESVRAPFPSHCLAHEQWKDPVANSPVDLLDSTRWWTLCARAARENGYALNVRFAEAVQIDRLRVSRPPGRSATRIEVHFHNRALSTKVPIYFREVPIGKDGGEARLGGPLKWNPNLLDDEGFRTRRLAAGLDRREIPSPLTVDGITVVFRALEPGDDPPSLGPVSLWLGDRMLPLADAARARTEHAKWVGEGIDHTLRGKHLQGGERVLTFDAGGTLYDTEREAWDAGHHEEVRVSLGRWQVSGGRLELTRNGKTMPIEYLLDDAPQEVWFQTEPVRGVYRIVKSVPVAKESPTLLDAPPAPTTPAKPVKVIPVR